MKPLPSMLIFLLFIASYEGISQPIAIVFEDSLYSPSLNSYSRITVVLPSSYMTTNERYTTLYLLHGHSGDFTDWNRFTGLARYAKEYNFIIICPDAKNSWYTNSPTVKNANYEDFVMKDLIPFVDKKYRTLATRHGRAIAGLSMGGYGAVKLALKYQSYFYYSASFSGALHAPAGWEDIFKSGVPLMGGALTIKAAFGDTKNEHWIRNDVFALLDSASIKRLPYFYLSVGHNDEVPHILESTFRFAVQLRAKGAAFELHETAGAHNWMYWDQEIQILLQKLSRFDVMNIR